MGRVAYVRHVTRILFVGSVVFASSIQTAKNLRRVVLKDPTIYISAVITS
jgi:RPA family protein